jgi:hypothetical protein
LGPEAWWSRQRFKQSEKRTLAATLVLGFSLSIENAHLTKCWDPDSIYFLSDSQGKCIHNAPYALCLASVPTESAEACILDEKECEARFALLARLLMEIECGVSLEHKQMKNTDPMHSTVDTLEDFIYDQISVDLSDSRRLYLEAVQTCFRFQQNCRREYKRMSARGHQGGQAAAARALIYSIVQKIQNAVGQQISDYSYKPPASFQFEQFGMSNGPSGLLPPIVLLNEPSGTFVKKKLQNRTRKVMFVEEYSEEEEEEETSELIVDSPTTTFDDCELFGDEDAQEFPQNLCIVAKKWTTRFKRLRREKTRINTEQHFKVAVLDTGVDGTHPSIRGMIADYKSFVDEDAMSDQSGHGTHIAGVIIDLTTNVDLYIGKVIASHKSEDRQPIIKALIHARDVWKVDMISLSFGFRKSSNPDLMWKEIKACLRNDIIVFASASNDAGNKPRTHPGDYDGVLCIHSATGAGNASTFNPSPVRKKDNFSFVGDCVKSCWPMDRDDFNEEQGEKYLSGTSIATPVAVSIAVFMISYIRKQLPEYHWDIPPCSPEGMQKIFDIIAHDRNGYNWVNPEWYLTGDNREEEIKAKLKVELRAYIPKPKCKTQPNPNS